MWGEEQASARWHGDLTRPLPSQEQRSAVFVVLFALITILILYSSNSANEVFHYGSLRARSRRPINLKKWSIADGYVPILGNKVGSRFGELVLPVASHPCPLLLFSPLSPSLLKEGWAQESRPWLREEGRAGEGEEQ